MTSERESQIESIQKIMKNSLDMIRISLVLPKIFENPIIARQRFKGSKYLSCLDLIEGYIKYKNSDSTCISHHPNYRLIKIIDLFLKNLQLMDHFKDWLDEFEPLDKSLVDAFQLLQVVTETRLKKSALSDLDREKKIHKLHQENEKIKRNIKVLQSELKSKSICSNWKQATKRVLIQTHEKDLAHCKYENNIRIKREIVQSSSNIKQIHVSSVARRKELEDELERIREIYEHLLRENLKKEKSAQNERNILIYHLETLIKKFDQVIGDKIKEQIFLQDDYQKQKKLFDAFCIAYHREECTYEGVVQARKEEEKRHHEQKILLFMMNRSARVIQKSWRKFRRAQKRAAKRNKGRGKSKKK